MTHIKWPNELGRPVPYEPNWQNEAIRLSALLHSAMLGGAKTHAKLALAIEALDEAIYLLDPDEEDMAKEAGLYRIVTARAKLEETE
jgi:hypothetical protein